MNQDEEFIVKIVREWDQQSLLTLFRAGGWWREEWDPAHIPDLVRASFAFAVAIHVADRVTAGMGRLISDGTSDAYIQDLVILPEYRGRGIGAGIVRALVDHCMSHNITWMALIAEPGTEDFYGTLGFSRMNGYVPMLFTGGSP